MILITGGMGFIGLHVARELAATDDVVLTYHRSRRSPDELASLVGRPVETVWVDMASPYALARAVGRYRPESIVHLAVPGLGALPPAEEILLNVSGLVNVLEAARSAEVRRITVASSVAVYRGLPAGPYRETATLPTTSPSSTSAIKKAEEVLAGLYADRTGIDLVLLRIGMVYGPLYHSMANLASRLVHLAVRGAPAMDSVPADESMDLVHAADCGALVASVHRSVSPRHRVYNLGAGCAVSAAELVDAVREAVPGFTPPRFAPPGSTPSPQEPVVPDAYMDITRVTEEFGLAPRHSLREGIASYAQWLTEHAL